MNPSSDELRAQRRKLALHLASKSPTGRSSDSGSVGSRPESEIAAAEEEEEDSGDDEEEEEEEESEREEEERRQERPNLQQDCSIYLAEISQPEQPQMLAVTRNQSNNRDHLHQQDQTQQQQQQQQQQHQARDYEEVKQVELFGVCIVALTINGKERLCLAQISNTLLKEFSYNEIHNRRVALGITCVQCTPIQLEMLRRAGAMPSSSRRCGMITMREAERLCRSFLVEEQPPELPENFYFTVAHRVNYGCKGRFVPARYISSRAKCIECFYCGEFYSPNKFIFHSHRQPHITECNPPDSPNINSWRKHIDLDWTQEHSQEIKYAWEDVKSLFNGGTRRRAPNNPCGANPTSVAQGGSSSQSTKGNAREPKHADEVDQLIDVECADDSTDLPANGKLNATNEFQIKLDNPTNPNKRSSGSGKSWSSKVCSRFSRPIGSSGGNSLMLQPTVGKTTNQPTNLSGSSSTMKRSFSSLANGASQQHPNKRSAINNCNLMPNHHQRSSVESGEQQVVINNPAKSNDGRALGFLTRASPCPVPTSAGSMQRALLHFGLNGTQASSQQSTITPFNDLICSTDRRIHAPSANNPTSSSAAKNANNTSINSVSNNGDAKLMLPNLATYPMAPNNNSSNFIYSQLYTQLMQPQHQQQQQQQQQPHQQHLTSTMDAQSALRHHLWSSLLANLQCNASNQTYSLPAQAPNVNHCGSALVGDTADITPTNLSHLISAQLYSQQPNLSTKLQRPNSNNLVDAYKTTQNAPFSLHKYPSGETNDIQ